MLESISIKNFKSIANDTIELGRVNVFIGENGCGKSNILEALAFASLGTTYETIDADLLSINGIRVAKPALMMSAFEGKKQGKDVFIDIAFAQGKLHCRAIPENKEDIYAKWESMNFLADNSTNKYGFSRGNESMDNINSKIEKATLYSLLFESYKKEGETEDILALLNQNTNNLILELESLEESKKFKTNYLKFKESANYQLLENFLIYTLNTPALRGIPEFQKSRKGIYGENLDVMIGQLAEKDLAELREYIYSIGWLEDFFIDEKDKLKLKGYKLNQSKSLLYFRDKFMQKKNNVFSVENANEGILHVLFYLTVLISPKTAKFFAIDNIETGLNPHLCRHLMTEMCKLAKEHDKQVLITTHNPAVLDGLNLFDDEIRLFVVARNNIGQTTTERILIKPEHEQKEGRRLKLSELWTRGYLGGISQDF